ncbi:hypothetical protein FGAF467_14970 [Escherichia coli]|nr:hypothetical protein FGAF467_14970 [Escherichia coli]
MGMKRISNASLSKMRKDAERMVSTNYSAADKEWWENLLLIVVELQDRRVLQKGGSDE